MMARRSSSVHTYVNVDGVTGEVCLHTAPSHLQTKDGDSTELPNGFLDVDFLLPNGIYLNIPVPLSSTIGHLKKVVWHRAYSEPFFSLLDHPSCYTLACVDGRSRVESLEDHQLLCHVDFFLPVFKIVPRKNKMPSHLISDEIRLLLGRDLMVIDNPEVANFRYQIGQIYKEMRAKLQALPVQEWLMFHYPPQLERLATATRSLRVLVKIQGCEKTQSLEFNSARYPIDLIRRALNGRRPAPGESRLSRDYVLQVTGVEEYLHGEHSLCTFKYISECTRLGVTPHLTITPLHAITPPEEPDPNISPPPECPVMGAGDSAHLWDIEQPFKIQILEGSHVTVDRGMKVIVRAGLFHGHKPLCQNVETTEVDATTSHPIWQQSLEFEMRACDLPRMTCLCLSLCSVHQDHRVLLSRRKVQPLAWGNLMVFDYNAKMKSSHHILTLWSPFPDSIRDFLNPSGCVGCNPAENGITLKISLVPVSASPVYFPSTSEITELGGRNTVVIVTPEEQQEFEEKMNQKPQTEYRECDRELIWKFRHEIRRRYPENLARLLLLTRWSCHVDVAQMIFLLMSWPDISMSSVLELLSSRFPDPYVEMFVVRCLRGLPNEHLSSFLLPFVQVLKTKPYIYNNLSKFLLERALTSRRIGQQLFWLLRSEMDDPSVTLHFSIILDIYCRTKLCHSAELVKQVQAVDKMKSLNDFVQASRMGKPETRAALQERLMEESSSLSHLCCPLDSRLFLKDLCVERCTFMQSKTKPLLFVYRTDVQGGNEFGVIYKSGDDLRQDMLVLNLIKIMDHLWKVEGLDLRMVPYGCVTTAAHTGLIEALLNSETIANIQLGSGRAATAAFSREAIFNWLQMKNPGESLQGALEEFTLSCAGYCVATYVLGIGDRHSDNIMIQKTGQMFHIDFGHILGKFKSKFGIRRERTPFILTSDFLHVIQHGRAHDESKFSRFQCLCDHAYSVLRTYRTLLLNVVSLMEEATSTDPNSALCTQYMKDSLAIGLSDDDALKNFRIKFDAAIRDSWKTKLNWWVHNLARDNR